MARERKIPAFYQIPPLLIATILAAIGFGISLWYWMAKDPLPRWVEAFPWGLGSAAFTLAVTDAVKHKHLSMEHIKVFGLAIGAVLAEAVVLIGVVVLVVSILMSGC